ncbi:MAG: peptidoglycan DD-metalloendopeptidase family protein [Eubacteriales bacterium]|nr:peptidoglycan DD-metalloendopeptidase family protein [Eubacteriales bacterium]
MQQDQQQSDSVQEQVKTPGEGAAETPVMAQNAQAPAQGEAAQAAQPAPAETPVTAQDAQAPAQGEAAQGARPTPAETPVTAKSAAQAPAQGEAAQAAQPAPGEMPVTAQDAQAPAQGEAAPAAQSAPAKLTEVVRAKRAPGAQPGKRAAQGEKRAAKAAPAAQTKGGAKGQQKPTARTAAVPPRRSAGKKRYPAEKRAGSAPLNAPSRRRSRTARPARRQKKVGLWVAGILAVLMLSGSVTAIAWAAGQPTLAAGSEVLLNGQTLGIVADRSQVEQAMADLQTRRAQEYGMSVACADELTYRDVEAPQEYFAQSADIAAQLENRCVVQVLAQVVMVDGRQAVALRNAEEAQAALTRVMERFVDPAQARADMRFVQTVAVEEHAVGYADVLDVETAAGKLVMGDNLTKENWHEVQDGETLEGIAEMYNLSTSNLYQANPSLAGHEDLTGVEKINAVQPKSWLDVIYTVTTTQDATEKFATLQEKSDSMYTTQTKVKQEGQDGITRTTVQTTYCNGELSASEVLNSEVLQEKIDKVVLTGTKKKAATTTTTTATGSWTLPLKAGTYRISSRFGTRTLNGVTKTHKGVDLAASKGTKIYASRDGTVAFSGTATGYGLVVYINHAGNAQTRYGHCSKLLVKAGQSVKKGDVIALVGSTGVSTGPHCHFEVRINGNAVNPLTAK